MELTDELPFNETVDVDKLILTKIVLRRSDALLKLKKYPDAADSLKLCLAIDPSNTVSLVGLTLNQFTVSTSLPNHYWNKLLLEALKKKNN